MYMCSMRKSFKDSLKVLEADIQHANTLASDFPRDYDGDCLQMRLSYSPAAHFFLFLVQWADCHLAGALGLLRILIYKVCVDGTTTMTTHERKASIREFYAVIYPSLLQLQKGVTDTEDRRQKTACMERCRRREEEEHRQYADIEFEKEDECGICMEMNSKIVLPNCSHAMCLKCYREWRTRSQSCPFCRNNLKRVNSGDLWIFMDSRDVVDVATVTRENLRRLFMYIDKLPLVVPDNLLETYDSHIRDNIVDCWLVLPLHVRRTSLIYCGLKGESSDQSRRFIFIRSST
ncbi:RING-type domain-containing protein [Psidium guajava]|nr:RING-type domain-containing protein [Psidium guajava]